MNQEKEDINRGNNITVKNKDQLIDFETLKKDYLRSKKDELNQIHRFNKDGKRYNTIQRPYETAQQKATKRANKLLDSKRQQEVEKLAAEKLGSHEKKCPICEHPFKDVHEFMSHLSKCNVLESSDDEEMENTDDVVKLQEDDDEHETGTEDHTNKTDALLPKGNVKIKVFHPYII